jgi:poly-gamma-glutamate synthesis protein (capsule biosynthesis protein)
MLVWIYLNGFGQKVIAETKNILVPIEAQTVRILAFGDIMLGRHVETLMNREGLNYPFLNMDQFVDDQEIVLGNLEGPIVDNHRQTADFTTSFSFKPEVADLLKKSGFTHIMLANNHTFDRGESGFLSSQKYLDEAGLKQFGHPRIASTEYILKEDYDGIEIIFIGFNEAVSNYFKPEEAALSIQQLKSENPKSIIIANIHWGTEYVRTSNDKQQAIAKSFIDAGAEVVLGHHPHAVQEIEEYNGKFIVYSLGNFVFDQYFSQDTQEGLAVELKLAKTGVEEIKLIPVSIKKSQPAIMIEPRKTNFINEVLNSSNIDNNLKIQW